MKKRGEEINDTEYRAVFSFFNRHHIEVCLLFAKIVFYSTKALPKIGDYTAIKAEKGGNKRAINKE
jgi:hypothetical protein